MNYLLTTLTKKKEVDTTIRDTIDKVLVLRFGRSSDTLCLQLDNILCKSASEVSKFTTVALVDVDSPDIQVYVKYFDITLIPSTIFFFNAHHMKMDSGNADHTKWVGSFHRKQDFIDVVEVLFCFIAWAWWYWECFGVWFSNLGYEKKLLDGLEEMRDKNVERNNDYCLSNDC